MFYTEEEAAFNRGLVETRVTTFQSRMRHGFPVNDPFLKPHSERSIQSLFFLLVGIIGWLALITPLRAQPAPIFTTARTFDTGPSPGKVAVGDFNGDGKTDLATLRSVVLGYGDGTFQAPINHGVGTDGTDVSSLAVGDFNHDGNADLVLTTLGNPTGPPGPGSVWVLLGNGNGSFRSGSSNRVGYLAESVAVGDFNGDGKFDLVVVNGMGIDMISVLLGKGDGTFQPAVGYTVGWNPRFVRVGDLNGDGRLDLVAANTFSENISVLVGNGDGTFQNAVNYSTAAIPLSVATADFNHDGLPDLAVGSQYGVVSVLQGNGNGTFQDAVFYNTTNAGSVVTGDFNGDNKVDIATPGSLLLGTSDGTFQATPTYPVGPAPSGVAVGDFNHDGKPDLAVANSDAFGGVSGSVSVLLGQGDGTVSKAVNYAAGSNPHSVVVGDFNADGKPDLAVANFGSGNVSVLLGQGDGTLQATLSLSMGGGAESVVAADFNDDGESDLVVAHIYSNFVTVLLNSGAPAGLGLSCVRRSNILSVSWALQSVGFVLESTTSLSLTNWQPAVEGQTTNNGRLEVSAPLDQPQRFFRLRAP